VFSSFQTCLAVFKQYLPKKRPIFELKGHQSIAARGKTIDDFSASNAGILLLSYDLGANGLNLQAASTVLILDFWWNLARTNQAVARVLRYGQKAQCVNIYYYTSNTGVESIIFKKQHAKLLITGELLDGPMNTKIPMIKMNDILRLIQVEENADLLKKVKEVKIGQKPIVEIQEVEELEVDSDSDE
jgi:SNF2 family DNA or RNA helicase